MRKINILNISRIITTLNWNSNESNTRVWKHTYSKSKINIYLTFLNNTKVYKWQEFLCRIKSIEIIVSWGFGKVLCVG